jgi:tetratricopeptide (TPR) repeat protein
MASLLSRVVLGAGLAATVMVGGPTSAAAQPASSPAAPADDKQAAAKRLTADAIAAETAKDYDKAIDLYRQAYALVPHPVLLANIARAHRLAGHDDEALTYYERYLAADPTGPKAEAARAAVAELKAAGATSKPDLDKAPAVTQDVPPPVVAQPAPMPALAPDAQHRTDTVGSPGRSLRITGLVLGGVGIASLAAGGYFGLKVIRLESDAQDEVVRATAAGAPAPTKEYLQEKYGNDGDAAERNQLIAYGVGGALLVGGAVTYWLGYRKDQKDRGAQTTAWMPVIGTNFAGITLTGSLP